MAFRGQESALAAKWETLRDDVHDAELRAYAVEARVAAVERSIHTREQPVDARAFRVVLWTVVVASIVLTPALSPWRPLAGETLESVLGSLATALFRAGPAVLYLLLGRTRSAAVSMSIRAVVLWVMGHFELQTLLPEGVLVLDVLVAATVVECARLLGQDTTLRRPSPPRAPALPVVPVGLDEAGWRRAVEEMERRVHFAHTHAVALAEREPRLRAHLERLERAARPATLPPFLPSFAALALLFVEQRFLLGPHLLGFGVAALVATTVPASLRAWSRQRLAPVALAFAVVRLALVTCHPWFPFCEISWVWLLAVCALEPATIDASSRIFRRDR